MASNVVGLLERYRLEIVPLTPLRIGAGVEGNVQRLLTSLAVIAAEIRTDGESISVVNADNRRVPVIPSSTVKGLLRAALEQLVAGAYQEFEPRSVEDIPKLLAVYHHHATPSEDDVRETIRRKACNISSLPLVHYKPTVSDRCDDSVLGEIVEVIKRVLGDYRKCVGRVPPDASVDWAFEAFASRYCPVCILFGSQFQAGALRVTDALPLSHTLTGFRTHVSIDRRTATKEEAKLYVEEYVEPGVPFIARMNVLWPLTTPFEDNDGVCGKLYTAAVKEAQRMLEMLIDYLASTPLEVGGGKSRGLGLVRILVKRV